ncbi:hypothetical protein A9Q84_10405 [Halobacteriovorax marinus]|uniref:Zinc-ribbon domain-containing protein n=1 Tax=Halobacteriovorax marinus TaxID=97084 RepID=A0A1Y5F769_9BACT|nr:hypothetical protein A9Q84_10405 [Halobacteriovorax marinus]
MLQEYAELKGGRLLSLEFENSTKYLLWECKLGHKWKASALAVMGKKSDAGSWCPKCPKKTNSLKISLDDIEMDD